MNVLPKVLILFFWHFIIQAQEFRVFQNYGVSITVSKNSNVFRLEYGEMLQVNGKIPFRILGSLNLSGTTIKKGKYNVENIASKKVEFLNTYFFPTISAPVGIEFFYKNFAIGLSQELFSFNLKNSIDSTVARGDFFDSINQKRFSYIFASPRTNAINTQLYFVVTMSESFSILVGASKKNNIFNLYDSENQKTGYVALKSLSPFFSIRFNLEK